MSRLAKKPITIASGVTVQVAGTTVAVKGAKAELSVPVLPGVAVTVSGSEVTVAKTGDNRAHQANIGTVWSLIRNAIEGVSKGFTKNLEIQGVGYRAAMEGKTLVLSLGYVHPVRVEAPAGVVIEVDKNNMKVSGANKELVGLTAAKIRALKKPEPYKGKGIRYVGEVVKIKAGKKAATA